MASRGESPEPRIVIVGAGPCGLGAAWRLTERSHANWTLLESAPVPGGLAASVVDPQGFTWDLGGHVLFSHYDYFDRLMDDLLGTDWVYHVREAWIRMRDRFIPYPLQNNIWQLPSDDLIACLDGLVDALATRPPSIPRATSNNGSGTTSGRGSLASSCCPTTRRYGPTRHRNSPRHGSASAWQRSISSGFSAIGPNSARMSAGALTTGSVSLSGAVPAPSGGTLASSSGWKGFLDRGVASIDPSRRQVRTTDGDTLRYDYLVSTMPLDGLLRMAGDGGLGGRDAGRLMYSSTHLVGIGVRGAIPVELSQKCWMYFPEPHVPFYRATVFLQLLTQQCP